MYSSETSDAIRFMLPNLSSMGKVVLDVDLRPLPGPKVNGYFGSGTLNPSAPG